MFDVYHNQKAIATVPTLQKAKERMRKLYEDGFSGFALCAEQGHPNPMGNPICRMYLGD